MARHQKTSTVPVSRNEDLIERSLEQIATILLRAGFDSPAAEKLLRRSFILAATKMASGEARRATQSQIASLAGVSRLEARKLTGNTHWRATPFSRFEALIQGWKSDPDFRVRANVPRPLRVEGAGREFEALVRKYGRDITKKTLREQLVALGFAKERDGKIFLVRESPSARRSTAASADLRFVLSQLRSIDFELGRREYLSRRISISTQDMKSAQALKQIAFARLETVLNSLNSMSGAPHRGAAKKTSHKLLVNTTVAVESEEKP